MEARQTKNLTLTCRPTLMTRPAVWLALPRAQPPPIRRHPSAIRFLAYTPHNSYCQRPICCKYPLITWTHHNRKRLEKIHTTFSIDFTFPTWWWHQRRTRTITMTTTTFVSLDTFTLVCDESLTHCPTRYFCTVWANIFTIYINYICVRCFSMCWSADGQASFSAINVFFFL